MSCKPAFSILVYPVISMKPDITHTGSRDNLIGKTPDSVLVTYLSNELQVTKSTPPSFLVHSKLDPGVKYQNSQLYYDACIKNKVPAKFILYPNGPHGFGLANGINGAPDLSELAGWPDTCAKWLETNGFFRASITLMRGLERIRSGSSSIDVFQGRILVDPKKDLSRLRHDFSGRAVDQLIKQ
jgi:acetyl esterase/lipase